MVGHSLGAGYSPLVVTERPGARLVHLCPAPVGPFNETGAPMRSSRPGFEFPPNREDHTSVWDPQTAIAVMYPRLEPEQAQAVADELKPGSSPADSYPLSEHPAVPTTFIYGLYDEFFDAGWSRWVAREVAKVEPLELETGHFPMLEDPDAVAECLIAAISG